MRGRRRGSTTAVALVTAVFCAVAAPASGATRGHDAVADLVPPGLPRSLDRGDSVPLSPPAAGFGSHSVWRQVVTHAPVAANSALLVRGLVADTAARYGGTAAFNVWSYDPSIYTVGRGVARHDVLFDNCQGRPSVPAGLYGAGGQFTQVPVPADAVPAAGTDRELSIYSPATDQLWDFWKVRRGPDGWHACWGGRIDHVSTSPGYFPGGYGATATGLASEAGTVTVADVRRGRIDHAVALSLPSPATWRVVSWPAQRSDGTDTRPGAIPEGTRLRLDPRLDVARLHLTPIAAMIARAAQRYGFVVTDKAGTTGVAAESGLGSAARTGVNPWNRLLGRTPSYAVLAGFPWNRLQALPRNYGAPRP